jgi:hypothetical protein
MADAADKTKEAAQVEKPEPVTMGTDINAAKIETMSAEIVTLRNQVAAMEAEKANKAKEDFESQVEACLKAGLPAADKVTLIQLGIDLKHSATAFSTLSAFAKNHKLTLGSQLGSVVTADEPKTGITPEKKAEALAALGIV